MRATTQLRLLVGASAGGHLTQLLQLAPCWEGLSPVFVSTLPIVAPELERRGRTYIIGECNRFHPLRALAVVWRALRIILAERPVVVLTTGSLPMAIFAAQAKLFGARIVWIDSITNVERLSLSGRFARRFADLCLTQWPHLASVAERIEYAGELV